MEWEGWEELIEQEFGILSSVFKCFGERKVRQSGGVATRVVGGGRKCVDVRIAATSFWRLK